MARALVRQLNDPVVAPFPETLDWAAIGSELHEALHTLLIRNLAISLKIRLIESEQQCKSYRTIPNLPATRPLKQINALAP